MEQFMVLDETLEFTRIASTYLKNSKYQINSKKVVNLLEDEYEKYKAKTLEC